MKQETGQPELPPDWHQLCERRRSKAGLRGSPLAENRTPGSMVSGNTTPFSIFNDPSESLPSCPSDLPVKQFQGQCQLFPLEAKPYPATLSFATSTESSVYDGQSNCENVKPEAGDALGRHAARPTSAIRHSLRATNRALEAMQKEHRDQVASLEAELATEREGRYELMHEIADLEQDLAAEQDRRDTLQAEVNRERSTAKQLRKDLKATTASSKAFEREAYTLREDASGNRGTTGNEAKHRERATKEEDKPKLVAMFFERRAAKGSITFDGEVDFRTILNAYSEDSGHDATRLTGRLSGCAQQVDLNEVFSNEQVIVRVSGFDQRLTFLTDPELFCVTSSSR